MKSLPKIILIYSTLFSGFIFLFGIITSKSNESFLFQLALLPVFIYFLWELISKNKNEYSNKAYIISTVVFVFLIAASLISLVNQKPEIEIASERHSNSPLVIKRQNDENNIAEEIQVKYITISLADKNSYVNIRNSPTLNSEVLDIGLDGQEYVLINKQDDWYEIQIDEDTVGFVSVDYAIEKIE